MASSIGWAQTPASHVSLMARNFSTMISRPGRCTILASAFRTRTGLPLRTRGCSSFEAAGAPPSSASTSSSVLRMDRAEQYLEGSATRSRLIPPGHRVVMRWRLSSLPPGIPMAFVPPLAIVAGWMRTCSGPRGRTALMHGRRGAGYPVAYEILCGPAMSAAFSSSRMAPSDLTRIWAPPMRIPSPDWSRRIRRRICRTRCMTDGITGTWTGTISSPGISYQICSSSVRQWPNGLPRPSKPGAAKLD